MHTLREMEEPAMFCTYRTACNGDVRRGRVVAAGFSPTLVGKNRKENTTVQTGPKKKERKKIEIMDVNVNT
jgi:hypothetical protein